MKAIANFLLTLLLLVFIVHQSQAQLDLFVNPRVTSFDGMAAKEFIGPGLELGLSIQDPTKLWVGGIHYQGNFLGSVEETPYSPYLNIALHSFNLHYGAKSSLNSFFHPYAYGIAGFRILSYTDPQFDSEAEEFFNTLTLTYGLKAGIQLGSGQWRGDLKFDYLRGTRTRYLVEDTFREAYEAGADFRDFTRKSPLHNISVGLGLVYVLGWE